MSAYEKIIKLLKENDIQYTEYRHEPVRTSAEAALTRSDVTLSQGAKALIVSFRKSGINTSNFESLAQESSLEKQFAMVVVPGDKRFDSKKVRKILEVSKLSFASEEEVFQVTNGVIPGGVPPFGNIFGIKTIVEKSLLDHEKIAFNAGDRSISIVMSSKDWLKICNPEVEDIV